MAQKNPSAAKSGDDSHPSTTGKSPASLEALKKPNAPRLLQSGKPFTAAVGSAAAGGHAISGHKDKHPKDLEVELPGFSALNPLPYANRVYQQSPSSSEDTRSIDRVYVNFSPSVECENAARGRIYSSSLRTC